MSNNLKTIRWEWWRFWPWRSSRLKQYIFSTFFFLFTMWSVYVSGEAFVVLWYRLVSAWPVARHEVNAFCVFQVVLVQNSMLIMTNSLLIVAAFRKTNPIQIYICTLCSETLGHSPLAINVTLVWVQTKPIRGFMCRVMFQLKYCSSFIDSYGGI